MQATNSKRIKLNQGSQRALPERIDSSLNSKDLPVAEIIECFPLSASLSLKDQPSYDINSLKFLPLISPLRSLEAGYAERSDIETLWKEKARLDKVFDTGRETVYYDVRDATFPQDQKGSSKYRNRAGDKLMEVHEKTHILDVPVGVFLDICGGPGAWSEVLLKEKPGWRGYGMTLKLANTPKSDLWYPHLQKDSRWKALWGVDGTGNVYSPQNLDDAARVTSASGAVTIAMADGGFKIEKNQNGEHMEHLQELFSGRIILSEFLAMMKTLQVGGNWVCKLFDTFSHFTASLVYINTLLFEECYIVKPRRSRIVNSERYLVGKRLRERSPQFDQLLAQFDNLQASWSDESVCVSVVPVGLLSADKSFSDSFRKSVRELCHKQTQALRYVMDEVEQRLNRTKRNRETDKP